MKKQLMKNKRKCLVSFLAVILFFSINALEAQDKQALFTRHELDSLRTQQVDVAFGKQSYNSVTSAISTIYSSELTKRVVPVVGDVLVGRLPGLMVRKTNGAPGSIPQLTIRGSGTYNATQQIGRAHV